MYIEYETTTIDDSKSAIRKKVIFSDQNLDKVQGEFPRQYPSGF